MPRLLSPCCLQNRPPSLWLCMRPEPGPGSVVLHLEECLADVPPAPPVCSDVSPVWLLATGLGLPDGWRLVEREGVPLGVHPRRESEAGRGSRSLCPSPQGKPPPMLPKPSPVQLAPPRKGAGGSWEPSLGPGKWLIGLVGASGCLVGDRWLRGGGGPLPPSSSPWPSPSGPAAICLLVWERRRC